MKCLLLKSFSSESRKYAGWHCDPEISGKSLSSAAICGSERDNGGNAEKGGVARASAEHA